MTRVILYTKPGCHLCEPVRETILAAQKRHPFEYIEHNILDDEKEFELYKYAIPVVAVDGKEIARYRLAADDFERALAELKTD